MAWKLPHGNCISFGTNYTCSQYESLGELHDENSICIYDSVQSYFLLAYTACNAVIDCWYTEPVTLTVNCCVRVKKSLVAIETALLACTQALNHFFIWWVSRGGGAQVSWATFPRCFSVTILNSTINLCKEMEWSEGVSGNDKRWMFHWLTPIVYSRDSCKVRWQNGRFHEGYTMLCLFVFLLWLINGIAVSV